MNLDKIKSALYAPDVADDIAELVAAHERAAALLKQAADLFVAIQVTDGKEEHEAICDGATLAATIDAELGTNRPSPPPRSDFDLEDL